MPGSIIQLFKPVCWVLIVESVVIVEEFFSLFDCFDGKEENANGTVDDDS